MIRMRQYSISLSAVLGTVLGNWWLVALAAFVGAGFGTLAYTLIEPTYSSRALVTYDAPNSGIESSMGSLGGLASLVGLSVGPSSDRAQAIATLKSRVLIQELIDEQGMMPVLFPEAWDANSKSWRMDLRHPPKIEDGIRKVSNSLLRVSEEPGTGLVDVRMRWTSAVEAQKWLAALLSQANRRLQRQAIAESEANSRYLQERYAQSTVVELRIAIADLIGAELKSQMIAQGRKDYAFRVVDPPFVPDKPDSPSLLLLVVLGAVLCELAIFLWVTLRLMRQSVGQGDEVHSPTFSG